MSDFDLSCYFVVGPADCKTTSFEKTIRDAVDGGITYLQLRAKTAEKSADAKEQIELCKLVARILKDANSENKITFVVNDRVDVVLASREMGIKVDGVHIGQDDIDPEIARALLDAQSQRLQLPKALIGLSCTKIDQIEKANSLQEGVLDNIGVGPWHPSNTKKDCGLTERGVEVLTESKLGEFVKKSKYPIVVGGGVIATDLQEIKRTGVGGFFVVSAIAAATDPLAATKELVNAWKTA